MFKLTRQRAANCGVHCLEDGLYLGSAALIERDEHRGYRIRTAAEIEALLAAAYEIPPDLAGCLAGLDNVSADLLAGHVALAQIRALQLRLFGSTSWPGPIGCSRLISIMKAGRITSFSSK